MIGAAGQQPLAPVVMPNVQPEEPKASEEPKPMEDEAKPEEEPKPEEAKAEDNGASE